MISADQDQVWPSAAMGRASSGRLTAAGRTFGHLLLDLPAAGHSLGGTVALVDGGHGRLAP
jgi:hypothetical protein